jgi:hypothetical protein
LVKATILGPPDSAKVPAKVRTTLKEVIIPVKDAWASIFELAAMSPEEAAAQQRTVDWKIFVTFMDDIVSVRTNVPNYPGIFYN